MITDEVQGILDLGSSVYHLVTHENTKALIFNSKNKFEEYYAQTAKALFMQKRNLARTFQNVEAIQSDFNVYRPILEGIPDAAIFAIEKHQGQAAEAESSPFVSKPTISKRDIIVASLAAQDPGNTIFSNVCFPPRSRTRKATDNPVSMDNVLSAVEVFTEAHLSAVGLEHHRHYHAVLEEDADSTLDIRNNAQSRSTRRQEMILEATHGALETTDVRVPSLSSHFQVIDALMRIAKSHGDWHGLNVWRLLPSGHPDFPNASVEYALRNTGQPIPGKRSLKYFSFKQLRAHLQGNHNLSIKSHYKLLGDSGFSVIVHCPDVVKARHFREAIAQQTRFWTLDSKREVMEGLKKLHQP